MLYDIDSKGCWIWNGGRTTSTKYGCYVSRSAHRVFYEVYKGQVPKDWHVHHLCHTRLCVNPEHLLAIDRREHNKLHRQLERKTCKHGHKMNSGNIYVTKAGHWQCMTCNRLRQNRYNKERNLPRTNKRLEIVEGVRKDFGTMPVEQVAKKWGISWRSVYRYKNQDIKKLGYFNINRKAV